MKKFPLYTLPIIGLFAFATSHAEGNTVLPANSSQVILATDNGSMASQPGMGSMASQPASNDSVGSQADQGSLASTASTANNNVDDD